LVTLHSPGATQRKQWLFGGVYLKRLLTTRSFPCSKAKTPEGGSADIKLKKTYAVINGSVFSFFRPNIKNKQASKNPTLGARAPSISGTPTVEVVALN
jgi:hypothetical protein